MVLRLACNEQFKHREAALGCLIRLHEVRPAPKKKKIPVGDSLVWNSHDSVVSSCLHLDRWMHRGQKV